MMQSATPTVYEEDSAVYGSQGQMYLAQSKSKLLGAARGQWQAMRELSALAAPVHYGTAMVQAKLYANNCIKIAATPIIGHRKHPGRTATERPCKDMHYIHATRGGAFQYLDISAESRQRYGNIGGWGKLARNTILTSHARRMILEAGQILEDNHQHGTLFLTGTLPGSTAEAMQTLAAHSGWIADRLTQWLRRIDKDAAFLYVYEWQKRGALHIHIVCGFGRPESYRQVLEGWHKKWLTLLYKLCDLSGVDVFRRAIGGSWYHCPWRLQAQSEYTQKSVSAYLSKYFSKGNNDTDNRHRYCPGRWWSVSYGLRRQVKEYRQTCFGGKSTFDDCLHDVQQAIQDLAPSVVLGRIIRNPHLNLDTGALLYFKRSFIQAAWRQIKEVIEKQNTLLQRNNAQQWAYQYKLTQSYSHSMRMVQ